MYTQIYLFMCVWPKGNIKFIAQTKVVWAKAYDQTDIPAGAIELIANEPNVPHVSHNCRT